LFLLSVRHCHGIAREPCCPGEFVSQEFVCNQ
jgi:hypothetical protein